MFTWFQTTCAAVRATPGWPLLVCCLVVMPASAQEVTPADIQAQPPDQASAGPPPAHLTFVDGGVEVTHDGVTERAVAPLLLLDGDVVRTANGRAEIVFGDGTLLHVDHDTELELLSPTRLRLIGGRVLVRVSAAATGAYTIDTQPSSVRLDPRGEYGLTADAQYSRLEVRVARGVAELDDNVERVIVRGGEVAKILGPGGRPVLQSYNSARWDTFDRWSAGRTNGFSTADSSRRVPSELRPYGPVLDTYGQWDNVAPYGNVWFPRVDSSWRPYHAGSWNQTRYGLTWMGHDPWAWPTHHYGRWGFTGASWYWIPASVWAPAWVSWGSAPGYVSWCPLGWNGQPVLGFWNRPGLPYYDPWKAWTIMPRDKFRGRRSVRVNAVDPASLPESTRRVMVVQNVPPASASRAVPRGTLSMPAATRSPGTAEGAVRRETVEGPRPGSVRRSGQVPRADTSGAAEAAAAPPALRTKEPQNPGTSEPRNPGTSEPWTPPVIRQAPSHTPPSSSGAVERRGGADRPTRENDPPRYTPPADQPRSRESSPPPGRVRDKGTSASPAPARSSPPPASAPKIEGKTSAPAGGSSGAGKRKPSL